MKSWQASWKIRVLAVVCLLMLVVAGVAYARAVGGGFTTRNNGGNVTLPSPDSDYYGQFHARFPAGVDVWALHFGFLKPVTTPGGELGGTIERFGSTLELQLRGKDFKRNIPVSADCEVLAGPTNAGAKVQEFKTEMNRLEATLSGDPDFEYFHIVAGGANGYPSPGTTVITDLGNGTSFVQSSFDIAYKIEYKGARGGHLDGQSGSIEGRVTMTAYPAGRAGEETGQ